MVGRKLCGLLHRRHGPGVLPGEFPGSPTVVIGLGGESVKTITDAAAEFG